MKQASFVMMLPAVALLAGCAGYDYPVEPEGITLHESTEHRMELKVRFIDGTICTADVDQAPSGQLSPCAYPFTYSVALQHRSITSGTPLSPYFEPYATVKVTRPADGRVWTWETPQVDMSEGHDGPWNWRHGHRH